MDDAPAILLPIPSCADARAFGVAVSDVLCDLEDAVGVAVCLAFLERYAGRYLDVPIGDRAIDRSDHPEAIRWLRNELGHGRWMVPLGSVQLHARLLAAVLHLSRRGRSVDEISGALCINSRTVTRHRARLRAGGFDLLPETDRIDP